MFDAIEFYQEHVKMYILKMNIDELIDNSVVMYYDSKSGENYQRPPLPSHYRKIASYFMRETDPILPSTILGAVSSKDYTFNNGKISFLNKIRIVDGQHRIAGMKCLKDGYCKGSVERYDELVKTFSIPVVVMVIDEKDSLIEVDAFINLNSKGKRVKTDLAVALKAQKFQKLNAGSKSINIDEGMKNALAFEVTEKINRDENSFWKGLIIQADENGKRSLQPISVIAFSRAIRPLVDKVLLKHGDMISNEDVEVVKDEVTKLVIDIWDCVIDKWPGCFGHIRTYDKAYNICKGIGVTALFDAYCDVCSDLEYQKINEFRQMLELSKVKEKDWIVGGKFTGLASYQGFTQVKLYIENKNPL